MVERIKELMLRYSLTSSQLADSIGVPRSSISHLLTGRNKPSLDFLLKLMKAYPDVDLYWFLNGKGNFPPAPKNRDVSNEKLTSTKTETTEHQMELEMEEPKSVSVSNSDSNSIPTGKHQETIERIVFFYKDGTFKTFLPK